MSERESHNLLIQTIKIGSQSNETEPGATCRLNHRKQAPNPTQSIKYQWCHRFSFVPVSPGGVLGLLLDPSTSGHMYACDSSAQFLPNVDSNLNLLSYICGYLFMAHLPLTFTGPITRSYFDIGELLSSRENAGSKLIIELCQPCRLGIPRTSPFCSRVINSDLIVSGAILCL